MQAAGVFLQTLNGIHIFSLWKNISYTGTNYVKKIKKFMQEGVTVPNRKVSTTSDAYEGSGASTGVEEKEKTSQSTDTTAVKATASDFEKVTVAVGTGDNAVTMTYGAYLKYLEMGSTGVG